MKNKLITVFPLLFLISCLPAAPKAESTLVPPTATPLPTDRAIYKDGLVPAQQGILNKLPGASIYEIDFSIADDLYNISGTEKVIYTNCEDVTLKDIRFRLFPNILSGSMTVSNITIDEKSAKSSYELNDSLLILPFESPLQPGQSAIIQMDFKESISQVLENNYGVQAYYGGVLALAHAYPMIAVYDDEGWNAEVPPPSGDVTYSDMALFKVTVDAPKNVILVGSGVELNHQDNGSRQKVSYEAGPVRDFYLAASADYQMFSKESNGVTFRFYANKNLKKGVESALEVAINAVEIYSKRYAAYPYTELDFVATPTQALGIEYPGMIAITEWIIDPQNQYLEATIAHEVGHQWFYNLVGNDQLDDPWLDESLTQFATMQYFADMYGHDGETGFRNSLEGRWKRINEEKVPVGLPVRDYSGAEYSAIVYGRGPLFFEALRNEIGTEAFDRFIKTYTQDNSFGISTPEILQKSAEDECSCNLSPLFAEWVFP